MHELFQPLNNGGQGGFDRCAGPMPTATLAQCQNTGLTTAQYGNLSGEDFGFQTRFGGNPDLNPEESDTVSFGFILNPDFLPALTLSADYFDIEISGAIAEPDGQFILDECLETGTSRFCDSINRDSATGLLWLGDAFINVALTNIGFIQTSGVDIVASYEQEIGRFGDLAFNLVATYLDTWDWQELPGEPAFDCIGTYEAGPCIRPRFEYLSNFRTTWLTPWDASISILWRHMSDVTDGTGDGNHLGSYDYIDLGGLWDVSEGVAIRVGVNNVFDDDPPITTCCSGNTSAEAYDALGRYWFTGFSVSF
jgi:outer membrane receptor protein involved in Fe transport